MARSRYSEAKDYFRQAIKADPGSGEAWSSYDTAFLYTIAEQFRVNANADPPSPAGSTDTPSQAQSPSSTPAQGERKNPQDEGC